MAISQNKTKQKCWMHTMHMHTHIETKTNRSINKPMSVKVVALKRRTIYHNKSATQNTKKKKQ